MNKEIQLEKNKGVLFQNTKKEGKQPDFRGEIDIDGVRKALAGWVYPTKTGGKLISLKLEELRDKKETEEKTDLPF